MYPLAKHFLQVFFTSSIQAVQLSWPIPREASKFLKWDQLSPRGLVVEPRRSFDQVSHLQPLLETLRANGAQRRKAADFGFIPGLQ